MKILFTLSTQQRIKSYDCNFLILLSLFFYLISLTAFSQEQQDSTKVNQLDAVLVAAIRVNAKTPISFSNLDKKDIKPRNLGQDIPVLMNYLPSVVTTSDAGNGVGYTGIRVRGSDATRINVTINGIPFNDAESHGTFWVNMPDFASSVESLQLQRGVGTSTNGAGAFGASLNMLTDSHAEKSAAEISNSVGSFGTRKSTVKFSSGLMNGTKNGEQGFEIAGRLSQIKSDGFIDRAISDLKSYFLQGTYVGTTTLIKALAFGGTEKTYQSWNGIDGETLRNDRTFNSAGLFTDGFGNTRFYENETDNYQQDHYQLHWNEKINAKWNFNLAFHYTKGKGYFENYKEDANFEDYNLAAVANQTATDLIRQKWLDNDFYGFTYSGNYKSKKLDFIFGGSYNEYKGRHFGKVIWARFASNSELGDKYYDNYGNKLDGTMYAKVNYQIAKKINLFGDLQYRIVNYKANGVQPLLVNDTFHFFNPKAGFTYDFNPENALYFSFARANREPNRTDYEGGNAKPEKLNDFELGWRHQSQKIKINTNIYYMSYQDQLILTGNLDDVGNPIRSNSEKSYRLGLEVDATISITNQLIFRPNFTLSNNKNINLNIDGQNFGNTAISYSPSIIAGSILVYEPVKMLQISWLTKFVGEQFMNNIASSSAKLPDYFVTDLNVNYTLQLKKVFKAVTFSGLLNNVLNKKYVSNGYMYNVDPYYYPQAGTNFLVGMTLEF